MKHLLLIVNSFFKNHPDVPWLLSISIGWITTLYSAVHDWLSLALLMVSIVGGCLSIYLHYLKIREKRKRIKHYEEYEAAHKQSD